VATFTITYGQVGYREQSLDYIFGSGYFIFHPFCAVLRIFVYSLEGREESMRRQREGIRSDYDRLRVAKQTWDM
jgi:hypothetical protein